LVAVTSLPVALLNDPDPPFATLFGKLEVNAAFAVPLLSKYCGVGLLTLYT
jgi:hypothetical protein